MVFHSDPNYDFPFIVKKLANGFEGQFEYIGENTENYKSFSVSIKKKL